MRKFISGKKIYLRGLTREDCNEQYLSFVNDAELLHLMEGIGYWPLDKEGLEAYIEYCNNPTSLLMGIFENVTDAHVGNIHLSQIKKYHHNCMYGIVLRREYMGKGYAYEASHLLIKHAFEKMNINRIQINVVDKNRRAIKLYKGLGAIKEGRLRESFYFQGKYHSTLIFALLKSEYFKKHAICGGATTK